MKIGLSVLASLIKMCAPAISKSGRLSGFLLYTEQNKVNLIGVDGMRMIKATANIETEEGFSCAFEASPAIRLIKGVKRGDNQETLLTIDGDYLKIDTTEECVRIKRIDNYPDSKSLEGLINNNDTIGALIAFDPSFVGDMAGACKEAQSTGVILEGTANKNRPMVFKSCPNKDSIYSFAGVVTPLRMVEEAGAICVKNIS